MPIRFEFATLACISLVFCGCSSRQAKPDRSALAGTWNLRIGSSCSSRAVLSDRLILHSDGRMEQHAIYGAGKHYDAVDEHWDILTERSVFLDRWLDLTDNPTGKPTPAGLSVEFTRPPLILVNPDSNCCYERSVSDAPR